MAQNKIVNQVDDMLTPFGFECHPFKVGWYNDEVGKSFILPYDYDTLAILVISTPDMFDKGLLPFVMRSECPGTGDLLDKCIAEQFNKIKDEFGKDDVESIHDFELLPSRRPKILVQTAGHVAGAAFYYQRKDLDPDPWEKKQNIYGVSIHPKYGGWFALRGVLIFKNVQCPDLQKKQAVDSVMTQELKKDLLERFNFHWQDWTFRDIIPVEKKYSDLQKQYFATPPKDRRALIDKFKTESACCDQTSS